jgi:ATP-dependent RNA helicase RhlB
MTPTQKKPSAPAKKTASSSTQVAAQPKPSKSKPAVKSPPKSSAKAAVKPVAPPKPKAVPEKTPAKTKVALPKADLKSKAVAANAETKAQAEVQANPKSSGNNVSQKSKLTAQEKPEVQAKFKANIPSAQAQVLQELIEKPLTLEAIQPEVTATFSSLIDDTLLLSCIEKAGFTVPTAVQAKALPFTLRAKDVCAFAQTGTGKTAVIAITAGQKLLENAELRGQPKKPLSMILVPTRELAVQVELDINTLLQPLDVKTIAAYGGDSLDKQIQALSKGVDVIVATPGRILDLYKNKHLDLDLIKLFVCDEADRMFDMGFIDDVEYFLKQIPAEGVQKLFTSATGSEKVRELAFEYLDEPEYLEANPETITPEKIKQGVYAVPAIEKFQVLLGHIKTEKPQCAIIFTNTKVVAEWVAYKLACNDVSAEALTGDLPQAKRLSLIKQIKDGKLQILVATDVLSRGLHVVGLSHVYNFDIPEESESFVHRIGRTARAGAEGTAVSFVCEDYGFHMGGVEQLLGFSIPVWTPPAAFYALEDKSDYPFDENGRIKSYPFAPSTSASSAEQKTHEDSDSSFEKYSPKKFASSQPTKVHHDETKEASAGSITAKVSIQSQTPQAAAVVGANRIVPASQIKPAEVKIDEPEIVQSAIETNIELVAANSANSGIQSPRIQPKVVIGAQAIAKPFVATAPADSAAKSTSPVASSVAPAAASTNAAPKPQFAQKPTTAQGSPFVKAGASGSTAPEFQNKRHEKVRDERFKDEKAREAVEEALAAAKTAADRRRALAAQPPRGSAEEALLSAGEKVGETLGFIRGKVESIANRGIPLFNELIERFRSGFQKQVDKQRDGN